MLHLHSICHILSFPTRRSSDLDLIDRDAELELRALRLPGVAAGQERRPGAGVVAGAVAPVLRRVVGQAGDDLEPRSEEHTSELKSLRHLVCRLLIEKKITE